ncbi:hypothetical protein CUMW_224460, partial [Citrus unshiu]
SLLASHRLKLAADFIMASLLKAPTNNTLQLHKLDLFTGSSRINRQSSNSGNGNVVFSRKRSLVPPVLSMSATGASTKEHLETPMSKNLHIPIMVNSCTGKMGKAVIKAADAAGLELVPVSFGTEEESGQKVEVCGKEIQVHGLSDRESVLASVFDKYPNMIVVDYTVPAAVNGNAELYSKVGVPFVMGTTGGDRVRLHETIENSNVYAVISPQMGKQVVAFLAAMEIMAEQFPGAFSGYSLQVLESHQAGKLDTSGTAKAVISCFQKLGVSFDMDQQQLEDGGSSRGAFTWSCISMYHLTSPGSTVSFQFQHNVCGRSIYAEGTVDAVLFLSKKVQLKADKRIYNMIDVLREGNMR